MDLELMKKLCCLTEIQLHNVLVNMVKKRYKKYWYDDQFIIAEGNIPICLIAHMDTVFNKTPDINDFIYDQEKTVLWSPYGSGFDDRTGIYIILQLVLKGYRPHLIFTHGEERGGKGAYAIVERFKKCPFKQCKALIQLDRAYEDDCVFYSCDNEEFMNYIESFNFTTSWGTFSDISVIAPAWGIAAVNLSVGYLDEHTTSERLVCSWTDATIEKVKKILDKAGRMRYYKYIPRKYPQMGSYYYGQRFQISMDSCLMCGKVLTPDVKSHYISDEEFPYCVCDECYQKYYISDEIPGIPFD